MTTKIELTQQQFDILKVLIPIGMKDKDWMVIGQVYFSFSGPFEPVSAMLGVNLVLGSGSEIDEFIAYVDRKVTR